MHPKNQEKTVFITKRGIYCYKVMIFDLRNVGATYQRLINKMFVELLRDTIEVYINDILVKFLIAKQHLDHLSQAFIVLKKYNREIKPDKYSFDVSLGKFLGYMVIKRGIEANPDQIQVVLSIPSPSCIKDV